MGAATRVHAPSLYDAPYLTRLYVGGGSGGSGSGGGGTLTDSTRPLLL